MPARSPLRPAEGDHHPYYDPYIALVPDGDVVDALRAQHEDLVALCASVPDDLRGFAYAPGKWTIEEVVGHVVDIERAFAYRVMCFVRGLEGRDQPDVDQGVMVPASRATERGLDSIARELDHLRRSNLELFDSLADDQLAIRGRASGKRGTARSWLYVIHGHAEHHARVLRERYLGAAPR
jgi:hypothetical protein